jgi:hypothetical protein
MIQDVENAFRECRRVLRSGGRLIAFDYQKKQLERLSRAEAEPWHVWSRRGLARRLCGAGFREDSVQDMTSRLVWSGSGFSDRIKSALYGLSLASGTWLILEAAA